MFGALRFIAAFIFIILVTQPWVKADVTGSFAISVAMAPEGMQTEAQKMING